MFLPFHAHHISTYSLLYKPNTAGLNEQSFSTNVVFQNKQSLHVKIPAADRATLPNLETNSLRELRTHDWELLLRSWGLLMDATCQLEALCATWTPACDSCQDLLYWKATGDGSMWANTISFQSVWFYSIRRVPELNNSRHVHQWFTAFAQYTTRQAMYV